VFREPRSTAGFPVDRHSLDAGVSIRTESDAAVEEDSLKPSWRAHTDGKETP
jgi:hypothetical protein